MDYIRSFDIRLEKDVYYAGEILSGHILLENTENIKIRGIRVVLRGKAHAEWKIMKSGERRTVKDDQYLLDDKSVIWGKDKHEDDGSIPILPRGCHQLPFKVVIDVPYASPPQGMKYFTIVGPYIDCMEEKYLSPMVGQDKKTVCCLCCQRGPIGLRVTLERTAYVSGENIRLHAQVENQSDQSACVKIKLIQYVEYFIDKGVLGVNKNLNYSVLEHKSPRVPPFSQGKYDSTLEQAIKLPVIPPTLIGVCRLIQVYYVLKVCLELEKTGDDLNMDFPFTVATIPFRIPNSPGPPPVEYVSPEFQIGQVYDGTILEDENVLLYRPVYVRIPAKPMEASKAREASQQDLPLTSSNTLKNFRCVSADSTGTGGVQRAPSPSDLSPGQLRYYSTKISNSASSDKNLTVTKYDNLSQASPILDSRSTGSSTMTPSAGTSGANTTKVTVDLHDVKLSEQSSTRVQ